MTLSEAKAADKLFLTPAEAGSIIGCDPQIIRILAKQEPWRLGFPVLQMGHRTRIHREPFIRFVESGEAAIKPR